MSDTDDRQLVIPLRPVQRLKRPCDRCAEREATRFGVAQMAGGERGVRWCNVGLCDRCAAYCAAPGGAPGGTMACDHSLVTR